MSFNGTIFGVIPKITGIATIMIFVISHISNLSEVQQDEYVTPACCNFSKSWRVHLLEYGFNSSFGQLEFQKDSEDSNQD